MKKIFLILTFFISLVGYSQPQTTHTVVSIAAMKTYSGKAERIYVTSTNEDYVNCPTCTADEILVYDGAGSRNWKRITLNGENDASTAGPLWQHSDYPYSPFKMNNTDTVVTAMTDPPTSALPLSGIFARRTLYYNDNILKTQKTYGHYLSQTYNWKDSVVFVTEGGDYNIGIVLENRFNPRGASRQATSIHGSGSTNLPYYSVASVLVNTVLENTASNYIYTHGWLSGVSSYLVAGFNNADTLERFSFYQTNSFLGGNSNVKKAYGFDFQQYNSGARIDSSFGLWDQYGFRHYLRGNVKIGVLDSTVTGYQFKVGGASYFNGLIQGNQGADVASTAGVMTLGPDGNVFEITGTNTITAIANTNKKNGYVVTLLFTSTAVLTDGTANSGANIGMELEGNTNFTGSATDAVTLVLSEIGGTQRWIMVGKSVN